MQKHLLYINLFAITLALALGACADEVLPDNPATGGEGGEKTPIELMAGWNDSEGGKAETRTVITDDETKPHNAFPANTSLYMLMQSDDLSSAKRTSKVTRTIMFALPQSDTDKKYSDVNYSESNEYNRFVKYWDDVYARDAAISIVAVCTPGMGPNITGQTNTKAWSIGSNTAFANQSWTDLPSGESAASYPSISWPIGNGNQISNGKFLTDQSLQYDGVSYIKNQDLCFSNNLNDNSSKGSPHTDGRLKFNWGTHKFNSGKLIFYHALSKLTFRFKKGEGFTDEQFKFNTGTNVKLTNFYSQGTFNIAEGEFVEETLKKANGEDGQNAAVDKIWQRTAAEMTEDEKSAYKYILDALVIPGTDMTTSDQAVDFFIYNNEYKLTMEQLYAAFSDEQKSEFFSSDKLMAGVHYIFTFTVGKQKIEKITASIVDWEDVTADNLNPSNARIKLQLEERGDPQTSDVAFYKKEDNKTTDGVDDNYTTWNWKTGYTNLSASYDSDHSHWTTTYFWESNKDFYHFRALMPASIAVTKETTDGDYATLTSAETYTDVCWGAPMKDDGENETKGTFKWSYDLETNGFDDTDHTQIYKAIGPTEDPVKLILFHMMSDLTFNIKTTTGTDAVILEDGSKKTKVEIVGFYPGGKVLLGNGLVKTTGTGTATKEIAWNSESPSGTHVYKYGAVPQDLTSVKLYITTPDNNQYIVDLGNVAIAKEEDIDKITSNNIANPYTRITDDSDKNKGKYRIDRWYPGFKYNYSFTLAKTGITDLQATIVDWETVTAEDETVTIK